MVYKCCVVKCRSDYAGEDCTTVFLFPKDEHLRNRWIKFVNRKDWKPTSSSYICTKHFEEKYYKKGENDKRFRLNKKLKPVPTIFDPTKVSTSSSTVSNLTSPISIPRRSPRKRTYQEDEYEKFLKTDLIKDFSEINETFSPPGYLFEQHDDHIIFYKLTENNDSIPEITDFIRVDKNLHVKLFYKGSPLPLPQWFRHGRNCYLSRKSMMENFPVYFQSQDETFSSVFDELREYKFNKRPVYSAKVIRYALFLRYTFIQSYKILLEDFPLPSLSLLQKIASGTIDVMKCAEMLRNDGKILDDICLLLVEMYLQKCEEYFGGDMMGSNDAGELY